MGLYPLGIPTIPALGQYAATVAPQAQAPQQGANAVKIDIISPQAFGGGMVTPGQVAPSAPAPSAQPLPGVSSPPAFGGPSFYEVIANPIKAIVDAYNKKRIADEEYSNLGRILNAMAFGLNHMPQGFPGRPFNPLAAGIPVAQQPPQGFAGPVMPQPPGMPIPPPGPGLPPGMITGGLPMAALPPQGFAGPLPTPGMQPGMGMPLQGPLPPGLMLPPPVMGLPPQMAMGPPPAGLMPSPPPGMMPPPPPGLMGPPLPPGMMPPPPAMGMPPQMAMGPPPGMMPPPGVGLPPQLAMGPPPGMMVPPPGMMPPAMGPPRNFNQGPTPWGPGVGPNPTGPIPASTQLAQQPSMPVQAPPTPGQSTPENIEAVNRRVEQPASMPDKINAIEELATRDDVNAQSIQVLKQNAERDTTSPTLTGPLREEAVDSKRAALLALSLLDSRLGQNIPAQQLPGFSEMSRVLLDPVASEKESPVIKASAVQALRNLAMARPNDPVLNETIQQAFNKYKRDPYLGLFVKNATGAA